MPFCVSIYSSTDCWCVDWVKWDYDGVESSKVSLGREAWACTKQKVSSHTIYNIVVFKLLSGTQSCNEKKTLVVVDVIPDD